MARAARNPKTGQKIGGRVDRFWQRVTQGMQMNELWGQFRADARTSYRLYSQEVDTTPGAGVSHRRHAIQVAKQVFWAFIEKLTPARRVLLLLALVLLLLPTAEWSWHTAGGVGGDRHRLDAADWRAC